MGTCAWFLWEERCCLFQLERMGRTAASLLPPGSCRWSRYPFDLPFQSSLGNFLGLLSEVGKFALLAVSDVLIWTSSWFWKLFHGHAVTLLFAGMKCAVFHWQDWIWDESCCTIKIENNLTDGEETKRSEGEVKSASVCFAKRKSINKQMQYLIQINSLGFFFNVEQHFDSFWQNFSNPNHLVNKSLCYTADSSVKFVESF